MNKNRLCINKTNAVYISFFLILAIMDINVFYLIPIEGNLSWIWGVYRKLLLVIVASMLFVWSKAWNHTTLFMKNYVVAMVASLSIIVVTSALRYDGNPLKYVLLETSYFLLIFLALPVYRFMVRNGKNSFFLTLNIVAFIWYVICIMQVLIYSVNGNFFLYVDHLFRNDNLRFSLKSVGCVMVVYNFCKIWTERDKKIGFNLLQFCLGMYCVFFIQQTRAFFLAIGGAIVAVLLLYPTTVSKKARNIMLLIVIACIIVGNGFLSTFLESFGSKSIEYNSTILRQGAFLYFWEEFVKNPILGHGIIAGSSHYLQQIKTGPISCYYYADTGFIGELPQLGIFITNIYIWPLCRAIKMSFKQAKEKTVDAFSIGFLVYILLSSPTVICLNPAYYFIWPIFIAFMEYERVEKQT